MTKAVNEKCYEATGFGVALTSSGSRVLVKACNEVTISIFIGWLLE